jgi:FkbM family methyltransferase
MVLIPRIKTLAVGRGVGLWAQGLRKSWQVLSSDWERRGYQANDLLAEYYVTRLCQPGGVFIDGGAHIGSITAAVLRHCPGAKVIAVEAIPQKAAYLSRKFRRATVVNCALGEKSELVTFHVDLDDSAWSTLAANDRRVESIAVEGQKLDEFDKYGFVDVLKLDLEGAELGALKGGSNLISRDRPIIMYESGPTDYMGYSKIAMFDWLATRDYRIFLPARLGKEAPAMSKEVYVDSHHYPFGTLNYFAVPAERIPEVSQRVMALGVPSGPS